MCGIAGIWNRDRQAVDPNLLHLMNTFQSHRGPDGCGILRDGDLGLGHTRLAILDPTTRGDQPMSTADGAISISFNGEIHNFLELRQELQAGGYCFRSATDTEVILYAYQRWGTECFRRMNGMWALALWDRRDQRLILSRDRFGIKPLFYAARNSRLAFSSEAKAILAAFPEEAELNEQEAYNYLLGGNPDSNDSTFFSNVKALLPATYAVFSRDGDQAPRSYWTLSPVVETAEAPEETLRELLADAVKIRLRSDCPVGVCVSGGLDSSSLARLAARIVDRPLHCFSLKYEDHPEIDESRYSALVADDPRRFNLHWVRPSSDQLLKRMARIVWHQDAPLPIRGRLAMWSIFAEASKYVKVVLVGEGGDELLGGYPRFFYPYLFDRIRDRGLLWLLSRSGRSELRRIWTGPLKSSDPVLLGLGRLLLKRFSLTALTETRFLNPAFSAARQPPDPARFFHTSLRKDLERPFESYLNNALWQEFRYVGIPELLRSEDALAMAHSLEVRPPFMDHRLVEFCFRLPYDQKLRDGWTKSLLRRSMEEYLPKEVAWRTDKKGMPTPYGDFLRQNLAELRALIMDGEAMKRGFLEPRHTGRILKQLEDGSARRRNAVRIVWRCACFELWIQQFLMGSIQAPV